ncbi:MAG: hypothetical protein RMK57_11950 [Bryobacterales bacterium]|nr:hypothetical protein [Bryobacteraceae bacterium]MDW8355233.1 hypothetical protein [Bryobacterales bacterium]
MPQTLAVLVGSWLKITRSECSALYPDRLRLAANGLYTGEKDPPGAFTLWDAGTWEVSGPGQIRISTANDAIITYRFTHSGDRLRFVDPDGCEFEYRREP